MKTKPSSPISTTVMDNIKSGRIRMKPRVYFLAFGCLAAATTVIATLVATYLVSILFYWVRIQTADTMAWGARQNLSESIESFPWWALALAVALMIVTAAFVRRQGRMYKHKTVNIIIVILASSLILGYGLTLLNIGASHSQPHQLRGRGHVQDTRQKQLK